MHAGVEERSQLLGEVRASGASLPARSPHRHSGAEGLADPLSHEPKPDFRLDRTVDAAEQVMKRRDLPRAGTAQGGRDGRQLLRSGPRR